MMCYVDTMSSINLSPNPSDNELIGSKISPQRSFMALKPYERWSVSILGILAFMPIISTVFDGDWSAVPFIGFISLTLAWLLASVSWIGFTSLLHFASPLLAKTSTPIELTNKRFSTTWGLIGLILGLYGFGTIASGAHDASILYVSIVPWLFMLVLTIIAKIINTPGVAAGFATSLWMYPIALIARLLIG